MTCVSWPVLSSGQWVVCEESVCVAQVVPPSAPPPPSVSGSANKDSTAGWTLTPVLRRRRREALLLNASAADSADYLRMALLSVLTPVVCRQRQCRDWQQQCQGIPWHPVVWVSNVAAHPSIAFYGIIRLHWIVVLKWQRERSDWFKAIVPRGISQQITLAEGGLAVGENIGVKSTSFTGLLSQFRLIVLLTRYEALMNLYHITSHTFTKSLDRYSDMNPFKLCIQSFIVFMKLRYITASSQQQ